MSRINLNIVARGDFSSVNSEIDRLRRNIAQINMTAMGPGLMDSSIRNVQSGIATYDRLIASTNAFSRQIVSVQNQTAKFGKDLESGNLRLGQYFDIVTRGARRARTELRELAIQQYSLQQSIIRTDISNPAKAYVDTPRLMEDATNKAEIFRQRQMLVNMALRQGSEELINWGKNTQWAGRQLMVGLTLPMAMLGKRAADTFKGFDQEMTRMVKVYGDGVTAATQSQLDTIKSQVTSLAKEIASKWGVSMKETAGIAAELAATGMTGMKLLKATEETTRLATLGEIDRQEAIKATIALQTTFALNTRELTEAINFLNATENATSTSLQDLVEGIPRAGTVVKQLGGDYKDLTVMMVAMREAGVTAGESANAIKSTLASLINPTEKITEQFGKFGISLASIRNDAGGDPVDMFMRLGNELNKLDKITRARLIETIFGKYQFARVSSLIDNLGRKGSQTQKVFELMGASAAQMAMSADRELRRIAESPSGKFKAAMERFNAALLPIGEKFLNLMTNMLEKASEFFEFLEKRPFLENLLMNLTTLVGLAGPLVMITGVFGNLLGTIGKFYAISRNRAQGFNGFGEIFTAESVAASRAAEMFENSLITQADAARVTKEAIERLNDALVEYRGLVSSMPPPVTGGRGGPPPTGGGPTGGGPTGVGPRPGGPIILGPSGNVVPSAPPSIIIPGAAQAAPAGSQIIVPVPRGHVPVGVGPASVVLPSGERVTFDEMRARKYEAERIFGDPGRWTDILRETPEGYYGARRGSAPSVRASSRARESMGASSGGVLAAMPMQQWQRWDPKGATSGGRTGSEIVHTTARETMIASLRQRDDLMEMIDAGLVGEGPLARNMEDKMKNAARAIARTPSLAGEDPVDVATRRMAVDNFLDEMVTRAATSVRGVPQSMREGVKQAAQHGAAGIIQRRLGTLEQHFALPDEYMLEQAGIRPLGSRAETELMMSKIKEWGEKKGGDAKGTIDKIISGRHEERLSDPELRAWMGSTARQAQAARSFTDTTMAEAERLLTTAAGGIDESLKSLYRSATDAAMKGDHQATQVAVSQLQEHMRSGYGSILESFDDRYKRIQSVYNDVFQRDMQYTAGSGMDDMERIASAASRAQREVDIMLDTEGIETAKKFAMHEKEFDRVKKTYNLGTRYSRQGLAEAVSAAATKAALAAQGVAVSENAVETALQDSSNRVAAEADAVAQSQRRAAAAINSGAATGVVPAPVPVPPTLIIPGQSPAPRTPPKIILPGKATGGDVQMMPTGLIRGPGTGTSDSIKSILENGSFVIKASSVRSAGTDTLDKLNARGFKEGGSPVPAYISNGEYIFGPEAVQNIGVENLRHLNAHGRVKAYAAGGLIPAANYGDRRFIQDVPRHASIGEVVATVRAQRRIAELLGVNSKLVGSGGPNEILKRLETSRTQRRIAELLGVNSKLVGGNSSEILKRLLQQKFNPTAVERPIHEKDLARILASPRSEVLGNDVDEFFRTRSAGEVGRITRGHKDLRLGYSDRFDIRKNKDYETISHAEAMSRLEAEGIRMGLRPYEIELAQNMASHAFGDPESLIHAVNRRSPVIEDGPNRLRDYLAKMGKTIRLYRSLRMEDENLEWAPGQFGLMGDLPFEFYDRMQSFSTGLRIPKNFANEGVSLTNPFVRINEKTPRIIEVDVPVEAVLGIDRLNYDTGRFKEQEVIVDTEKLKGLPIRYVNPSGILRLDGRYTTDKGLEVRDQLFSGTEVIPSSGLQVDREFLELISPRTNDARGARATLSFDTVERLLDDISTRLSKRMERVQSDLMSSEQGRYYADKEVTQGLIDEIAGMPISRDEKLSALHGITREEYEILETTIRKEAQRSWNIGDSFVEVTPSTSIEEIIDGLISDQIGVGSAPFNDLAFLKAMKDFVKNPSFSDRPGVMSDLWSLPKIKGKLAMGGLIGRSVPKFSLAGPVRLSAEARDKLLELGTGFSVPKRHKISINTHPSTFLDLLEGRPEGRGIGNMFHPMSSMWKGGKYTRMRLNIEDKIFGIPKDAGYQDRPIYGYLRDRSRYDMSGYGDLTLDINPSALRRVTTTKFDSFVANDSRDVETLSSRHRAASPFSYRELQMYADNGLITPDQINNATLRINRMFGDGDMDIEARQAFRFLEMMRKLRIPAKIIMQNPDYSIKMANLEELKRHGESSARVHPGDLIAAARSRPPLPDPNWDTDVPGGFAGGGGPVYGAGGPTDDMIPARLSNGEYVVSAKGHRAAGTKFLDSINNGEFNMRYAQGGAVTKDGVPAFGLGDRVTDWRDTRRENKEERRQAKEDLATQKQELERLKEDKERIEQERRDLAAKEDSMRNASIADQRRYEQEVQAKDDEAKENREKIREQRREIERLRLVSRGRNPDRPGGRGGMGGMRGNIGMALSMAPMLGMGSENPMIAEGSMIASVAGMAMMIHPIAGAVVAGLGGLKLAADHFIKNVNDAAQEVSNFSRRFSKLSLNEQAMLGVDIQSLAEQQANKLNEKNMEAAEAVEQFAAAIKEATAGTTEYSRKQMFVETKDAETLFADPAFQRLLGSIKTQMAASGYTEEEQKTNVLSYFESYLKAADRQDLMGPVLSRVEKEMSTSIDKDIKTAIKTGASAMTAFEQRVGTRESARESLAGLQAPAVMSDEQKAAFESYKRQNEAFQRLMGGGGLSVEGSAVSATNLASFLSEEGGYNQADLAEQLFDAAKNLAENGKTDIKFTKDGANFDLNTPENKRMVFEFMDSLDPNWRTDFGKFGPRTGDIDTNLLAAVLFPTGIGAAMAAHRAAGGAGRDMAAKYSDIFGEDISGEGFGTFIEGTIEATNNAKVAITELYTAFSQNELIGEFSYLMKGLTEDGLLTAETMSGLEKELQTVGGTALESYNAALGVATAESEKLASETDSFANATGQAARQGNRFAREIFGINNAIDSPSMAKAKKGIDVFRLATLAAMLDLRGLGYQIGRMDGEQLTITINREILTREIRTGQQIRRAGWASDAQAAYTAYLESLKDEGVTDTSGADGAGGAGGGGSAPSFDSKPYDDAIKAQEKIIEAINKEREARQKLAEKQQENDEYLRNELALRKQIAEAQGAGDFLAADLAQRELNMLADEKAKADAERAKQAEEDKKIEDAQKEIERLREALAEAQDNSSSGGGGSSGGVGGGASEPSPQRVPEGVNPDTIEAATRAALASGAFESLDQALKDPRIKKQFSYAVAIMGEDGAKTMFDALFKDTRENILLHFPEVTSAMDTFRDALLETEFFQNLSEDQQANVMTSIFDIMSDGVMTMGQKKAEILEMLKSFGIDINKTNFGSVITTALKTGFNSAVASVDSNSWKSAITTKLFEAMGIDVTKIPPARMAQYSAALSGILDTIAMGGEVDPALIQKLADAMLPYAPDTDYTPGAAGGDNSAARREGGAMSKARDNFSAAIEAFIAPATAAAEKKSAEDPISMVGTLESIGIAQGQLSFPESGIPDWIPTGDLQYVPLVTKKAFGGYISGPGGPRDDLVPAMLSDGEYVIQANAVDHYGKEFFDSVNHKKYAKKFAFGGKVQKYHYGGGVPHTHSEPQTTSNNENTGDPSGSGASESSNDANTPVGKTKAGGISNGMQLMQWARQFLGLPYNHAAKSGKPDGPGTGFGCSPFTSYVLGAVGTSIPAYSPTQMTYGRQVDKPFPGDLLFWRFPWSSPEFARAEGQPNHVGFYYGGGQMLHSSGGAGVNLVGLGGRYDMSSGNFLQARAVLPDSFRRIIFQQYLPEIAKTKPIRSFGTEYNFHNGGAIGYSKGGEVMAMVQGGEVVVPTNTVDKVNPLLDALTNGTMGMGEITNNITINGANQSPEQIAKVVVKEIERSMKRTVSVRKVI